MLFTLSINVFSADLTGLGLCKDIDGTLKPIEKLVCESSAALLEAMNPTQKIPSCSEKVGPVMLSGDKPISAVFISCTIATINSCRNIASSVMKKQPGVTINVLVTSEGISNRDIMSTLINLTDEAKEQKVTLNILPINAVTEDKNIIYMRDPSVFVRDNAKTSLISLPYSNQNIPGTIVMNEAMKWCGIESTDTYRNLSSFNQAYDSLVIETDSLINEKITRELKGIQAVNDVTSKSSTMGGNLLALPNGTIVTGYHGISRTSPAVLKYFSEKQKVLELELPRLAVGHIDEIVSIVPSTDKCGYTILQASPGEGIKYLKENKERNEPFLMIYDQSLMMNESPEKNEIQLKLQAVYREKSNFMEANYGISIPEDLSTREFQLIEQLSILDGAFEATPSELLSNKKIIKHWEDLETSSNNIVKEILNELNQGANACTPKVIKLPVFWDYTLIKPLIPNPVNGLAVNGTYFRSLSKGAIPVKGNLSNRRSHPSLDIFIDKKISHLFPNGIQSVDTGEHDAGLGNFHCATTNIYLPCK